MSDGAFSFGSFKCNNCGIEGKEYLIEKEWTCQYCQKTHQYRKTANNFCSYCGVESLLPLVIPKDKIALHSIEEYNQGFIDRPIEFIW